MAVAKSKSGHLSKPGQRGMALARVTSKSTDPQDRLKTKTVKRVVASKAATKGIMSGFSRAVQRAVRSGRPVQMTVVIEPDATASRIDVEDMTAAPIRDDLDIALRAAKARGAARVADILNSEDMLTADDFAKEIGATRETVHKKRKRHEVLGLEGPKRGVRFPIWQLSRSGELLGGLPLLFEALGDHPWAVYRFLSRSHPEFDGDTGLEALKDGRVEDVIQLAGSIGAGAFE